MELEVNNLSFGYAKNKMALDNVSFTARGGRSLFILGPNGAGKSTLVSCILQFIKYPTGTVSVDGKNLAETKGKERAKLVGYVPQNVSFPSMTVFDAVLLGRKPYIKWDAGKNDLQIAENVLKALRLEEFSMRDVSKLSGGEQQKIAVARALAQQAPIMIFDELTSNLDVKNQFEVLEFLKKITQENNLTTITIVHDLGLALRFADDVLLLKNGKIVKFGEIGSLTCEDIKNTFGIEAKIMEIDGRRTVIYGG